MWIAVVRSNEHRQRIKYWNLMGMRVNEILKSISMSRLARQSTSAVGWTCVTGSRAAMRRQGSGKALLRRGFGVWRLRLTDWVSGWRDVKGQTLMWTHKMMLCAHKIQNKKNNLLEPVFWANPNQRNGRFFGSTDWSSFQNNSYNNKI